MTTERIELPDFAEAERLFEEFVLQNGGSGQLTWVFREDLNLSRKKNEILILHPDKALNRALVENAYEESKNQAFGILFDVFCPISEGGYCAYFLIPKDIEDAELRMVYGLKFGTLGSGIRRIGRLSRRPRALGSFMRRFGRERSDPWLLDVPSRQAWT